MLKVSLVPAGGIYGVVLGAVELRDLEREPSCPIGVKQRLHFPGFVLAIQGSIFVDLSIVMQRC